MIPFHRLLIGTAIAFCIGFAVWTLDGYRSSHSGRDLAFAVAFAFAGALLGYYLKHLDRFLHR